VDRYLHEAVATTSLGPQEAPTTSWQRTPAAERAALGHRSKVEARILDGDL